MSRGEHPLDESRRTGKRPPELILRRALCEWCDEEMVDPRPGHRFCKTKCRQAAQRFRIDPAAPAPAGSRRMSFAYADPPYPGLARRYYDCDEVDHAELVLKLAREHPDGWGLSTSADALPFVLSLIPAVLKPRVAVWDRLKPRARDGIRGDNRWEPLVLVGGRARRERVDDLLAWGGRQHSHAKALVGMKPAPFCEWLFRHLGAARGDELVDMFPGSGAVGRAWRMFTSDVVESDRRFRPGRLASLASPGRHDARR